MQALHTALGLTPTLALALTLTLARCGAALVGRFAAHGVHFKVGTAEPRPSGLAAHGWLLLVLISWAWLGAVTFVRAPELVSLGRSAANLMLEALPPLQVRV